MNAFKTYAEVDDRGRLVVDGVPFRAGSLLEVLLVDAQADAADPESWRALFAQIRSLPQSQGLTDADLTDEIDAWRSGR